MTRTDVANLRTLLARAARISPDVTWQARYAAERYYGLVTCGPYVAAVERLARQPGAVIPA